MFAMVRNLAAGLAHFRGLLRTLLWYQTFCSGVSIRYDTTSAGLVESAVGPGRFVPTTASACIRMPGAGVEPALPTDGGWQRP